VLQRDPERRNGDRVTSLAVRFHFLRLFALVMALLFATGCPSRQASSSAVTERDASADSKRVKAADGAVSGPALTDGWQWMEDKRSGEGFTLVELKWRRPTNAGDVLLYAKDYSVSADETMASLSARDWRTYYNSSLKNIRSLDVRPVTFAERPALDVRAEGTDAEGTLVLLHEVYVPFTGHVFLTSAVGPLEEVVALAPQIASWRQAIEFRALR
jgi:hypothetical protein